MLLWLLALLVVAVGHRWIPAASWLLVHLLLLGAATNAILVWSAHFSDAVLRASPGPRGTAGQAMRLLLLNLGIAGVVAGMVVPSWPAVLAGGILVAGTVIWHGAALAVRMRRALPSRFRPTVHYYLAGAALLPFGVAAGVLLAAHSDHDRLVIAHLTVNLLGWVGLTVIGTLVTLWPTMLRTRVVDGAERAAGRALPILLAAVIVTAVSALLAPPPVATVGLAGYLAGIAVTATPLIREARAKPPAAYASYSVAAGCGWLAVGLVGLLALTASSASWSDVAATLGVLAGPLAAGFAAQVLLGALSYLIPVVAGGGPVAVRAATAALDRGAAWRVSLINCGIAVWVLPVPSLVAVVGSVAALVGFAAFLPLLALALRASYRARRDVSPGPSLAQRREAAAAVTERRSRPGRFAGPAAAAFVAVALAVAGAVALDPAAVSTATTSSAPSAADGVSPTGRTTTVHVTADNMRFTPHDISVPAGNRLVIKVANTDTMVHDLVLDTGATTGRLSPGTSGSVTIAVVGRDIAGWCSIVGHRQLGMVMQITVTGLPPTPTGGAVAPWVVKPTGAGDMADMSHSGGADTDSAASLLDFMAAPPAGFTAHDATLPPVGPGTVHRVTLTVTDTDTEVAPGVRQTLWTYGANGKPGTMPGPTLHGRVGDEFVVHLVNDGDMGHSVDFHAGELAPDEPMRTIAPGESLDYTFTATRSGIWLYHCSTMPMSAHIANGMFGAVIIDPPDLAPVDREYVLVSSELYLGPQDGTVDVDKVAAMQPDAVVFNGYANGYDADPLTATAGRRIRIWVLNAGPNEPLAFHVVGMQFDTVFSEGAYLLRPGNMEHGGSQVLSLAPAQGGFVEFTPPQAGHYPFVSHIMANAERGEHGVLAVGAP